MAHYYPDDSGVPGESGYDPYRNWNIIVTQLFYISLLSVGRAWIAEMIANLAQNYFPRYLRFVIDYLRKDVTVLRRWKTRYVVRCLLVIFVNDVVAVTPLLSGWGDMEALTKPLNRLGLAEWFMYINYLSFTQVTLSFMISSTRTHQPVEKVVLQWLRDNGAYSLSVITVLEMRSLHVDIVNVAVGARFPNTYWNFLITPASVRAELPGGGRGTMSHSLAVVILSVLPALYGAWIGRLYAAVFYPVVTMRLTFVGMMKYVWSYCKIFALWHALAGQMRALGPRSTIQVVSVPARRGA